MRDTRAWKAYEVSVAQEHKREEACEAWDTSGPRDTLVQNAGHMQHHSTQGT